MTNISSLLININIGEISSFLEFENYICRNRDSADRFDYPPNHPHGVGVGKSPNGDITTNSNLRLRHHVMCDVALATLGDTA